MRYQMDIPRWRPPLCNLWRGRHWSVAHKLRKETTQLLATYARMLEIPKATRRRRVAVDCALGPRQRQPDADAIDKILLDALVQARLLLDDSERGIAGRVEVRYGRGTPLAWGTTIFLTEVEEDPCPPSSRPAC